MDRAAVALLLISKDFLTSGFIQGTEVPHLLKRRREEGLRVIPLFVRPCAWSAVDCLAAIQGRPKDAKPLSGWTDHEADQILTDLALEIRAWLRDGREEPVREAPAGGAGMKPGVSTPGSVPPTTPSPEGAEASAWGGGKKVAAFREDASDVNEKHLTVIRRPNGDTIGVRQIAGLLARRVVCYLREGDHAHRGQPMGLIKFGSRVDLLVPESYELKVRKGDRVKNGATPMAHPPGEPAS